MSVQKTLLNIVKTTFNSLGFKQGILEIKSIHLLGYRGESAVTTGIILADTLKDWHNPEIVNRYMKSFGFKTDFFFQITIKKI